MLGTKLYPVAVYMAYNSLFHIFGLVGGQIFKVKLPKIDNCGFRIQMNSVSGSSTRAKDIYQSVVQSIQKHSPDFTHHFVLHNKIGKETIPAIFRSMMYECYIHVHINVEGGLFHSIPLVRGVKRSTNVLYKQGTFFIVVFKDPKTVYG